MVDSLYLTLNFQTFNIELYFMFFYLSKILDFLIEPICWVFVLLLIGLLAKSPKKKKCFLIASFITLYFFSNSFILDEILRKWEVPAVEYKDLKQYDVAVVLGGMITYDPTIDRLTFDHGSDRFLQALELYKKGHVKKMLIVGGSGSLEYSDMKEALLIQRYLKLIGIPEQDILVENESRNTRENAAFSVPILQKEFPNGNYLLVTSGMHMRRANACFEKVGLHCDLYAVDRNSGPRKFYPDHLFIPNVGVLNLWEGLIHEWVGIVTYKVMGYI